MPLSVPAVDLIAQTIRESAEPVTLIPTGPLPNIALLLLLHPELKPHIERICLMGGGVYEGNATPAAEANFRNDPEAARVVFQSGVPITMVGLNVTHRALFTTEHIARLRGTGRRVANLFAEMLEFRLHAYGAQYGYAGAPLHDPDRRRRRVPPRHRHDARLRRDHRDGRRLHVRSLSRRSDGRDAADAKC